MAKRKNVHAIDGVAVLSAAFACVCLTWASRADAEPLRLRADAYAQTPSPTGLLVLAGEDRMRPWVSAEGLVWLGAGRTSERFEGDVLNLALKLRDPSGLADLRVGRILVTMGAIRPQQLDGAVATARVPTGTTVELFGGAPVVPRLGERDYDWAAGGRLSQSVRDLARVGLSYVQKRDRGDVAQEELGGDMSFAFSKWDLASRAALDLLSRQWVDASLSSSIRLGALRLEAFGSRRLPSRLLPATSLFSVLGDAPATRGGLTLSWRAAPRLDLSSSVAAYVQDARNGLDAFARGRLRLDDDGRGVLGAEIRRQSIADTGWLGARVFFTLPLSSWWSASGEMEWVRLDQEKYGARWFPWGLVAMTLRPSEAWAFAAAIEASARPSVTHEVVALLRASYTWGAP